MENDFDSEFMQLVKQAPEPQQKKSKARVIIIIIAAVILLAIVISIIFLLNGTETVDQGVGGVGDITEVKESLNQDYQQAVNDTPHADYKTERKDTAFSSFTVPQLCNYLNVTCTQLAAPAALPIFKPIEALNSNSLDYYLDNGHIIIMTAIYTDSADPNNPYPYVIYARTGGLYYVFDPNSQYMVNMTMEELFNEIVGIPQFYATERSADGL